MTVPRYDGVVYEPAAAQCRVYPHTRRHTAHNRELAQIAAPPHNINYHVDSALHVPKRVPSGSRCTARGGYRSWLHIPDNNGHVFISFKEGSLRPMRIAYTAANAHSHMGWLGMYTLLVTSESQSPSPLICSSVIHPPSTLGELPSLCVQCSPWPCVPPTTLHLFTFSTRCSGRRGWTQRRFMRRRVGVVQAWGASSYAIAS